MEVLREHVASLERKLALERERRKQANAVMNGLRHLVLVEDVDEAFAIFISTMRDMLDFEHAAILTCHTRCPKAMTRRWEATLATAPELLGARWTHGTIFERAVTSTRPIIHFDITQVDSWQPQGIDEAFVDGMRSTMHIPLQWGQEQAILLCTHGARAAFHTGHVEVARQIGLLAFQVFASLTHRDSLIERDAAHKASVAKSAFLASMSHELRTPLNIIIGYAELILDESSSTTYGEEALSGDISKVLGSARHLLGIVSNMLDLSRIEQHKMALSDDEVELGPFLDAIVQSVRPSMMARDNVLELATSPDLPMTFQSDETRLRQILLNLLSNAARFTLRGRVTLRVSFDQGVLVFEVEDTGKGIAPEELSRLFDLFERIEHGFSQNEGAGLGLPISKKLAELLGGRIDARSVPGEGSCFTLHLPVNSRA